ncbi:uncharacterized protein VP01_7209g1, partial [Puccinia sorghi]
FMKDYTATWSHLYLEKVFNGELVVFNDFLNDFRSRFFDHNRRNRSKVALQNLRQTGTVRVRQLKESNQASPTPTPSPVPVPEPPPPNLMQLTSLYSATDSPTQSKPVGFSRTSVSVEARRATYPVDAEINHLRANPSTTAEDA